jgi:hypothetical protein
MYSTKYYLSGMAKATLLRTARRAGLNATLNNKMPPPLAPKRITL